MIVLDHAWMPLIFTLAASVNRLYYQSEKLQLMLAAWVTDSDLVGLHRCVSTC